MRLALLAVLLAGCVHTRPASVATEAGRADLNARTAGRVATLTLRSAGSRPVRNLHVGPDEATWVDRLTGQPQSAPAADVVAVTLRRGSVWRSALIGTGIGAIFGGVAAIGQRCNFICFSPAVYVGLGALDGGLLGAAVGAAQTERHRVDYGPRPVAPADTLAAP